MAEGRLGRASVRLRTTAAAMLVVAIALLVGAFALVALVRGSLRDGLETSAEQRASAIADQIESSGLPEDGPTDDDEDADDPDDLVWQVTDADGTVVRSSQPLSEPLPTEDADAARLPGADHQYVVVTEDAEVGEQEYSSRSPSRWRRSTTRRRRWSPRC